MKVSLHKIEHQVQIFIILRPDDREQSNDVFMSIEMLKIHDLSVGPLRVGGVLKGVIDFFQCHEFVGLSIQGFENHSVSPFAKFFKNFKPFKDMRF